MKIVKEIACCLLLSVLCLEAFASKKNNGEVLKFMDIPMDCSKSVMEKKLQRKGFKIHYYYDGTYLTGNFNGHESTVIVNETKKKVDEVKVIYAMYMRRSEAISTFNTLLTQFQLQDKYIGHRYNAPIPESEDLSAGLRNGKTYEAGFSLKTCSDEEIERIRNAKDFSLDDTLAVAKILLNSVFFHIYENEKGFNIVIIYDNMANKPNGQDL